MRRTCYAAVFLLLLAPAARASDADTLFQDGVKLLEAKNYKLACEKLERSQALDPAAGTLLNLATCYERDGRPALAWQTYQEAMVAARARKREDWVSLCEERARAIERKASKIRIRTTSTGVRVRVDDRVLTQEELSRPVIVDAGAHRVEFSAKGFRTKTIEVTLQGSITVNQPPLDADTAAEPLSIAKSDLGAGTPARDLPPVESSRGARTAGLVIGGVGLLALAGGGLSMVVASGALSDAKGHCAPYPEHCTAEAASPNERAQSWSSAATWMFVGGVALTTVGVTLLVIPTGRSESTKVVASDRAVYLQGAW